jgi:hypothetical protein
LGWLMAIMFSRQNILSGSGTSRRRNALLAATALSGGFALMMANPQSALATCAVTSTPNTVDCATTTTTNSANTDAGAAASNSSEQLFTKGGNVAAQVEPGAMITGFGLSIESTQPGANIIMNNQGTITNSAGVPGPAGGTSVEDLNANGGNVSYIGNGSVFADPAHPTNALVLTTVGNGIANVGSSGAPITGQTFTGVNAIVTSTGAGNANIFLSGGTVTATGGSSDAIHGSNTTGGDFNVVLTGGTNIVNGSGAVNQTFGIGVGDGAQGGVASTFGPGNVNITSNANIGTIGNAMAIGIAVGNTTALTGNINIELTGGTIAYAGPPGFNGGILASTAGSILVTLDAGSVITAKGNNGTAINVASTSGAATVNVNGTIDAPDIGVAGAPTVNVGATGVIDANDIGVQATAVGAGAVNVTTLAGSVINQGNGVGGSAQNANVAAPLGGIITTATSGNTVVNVGGVVAANAFGINSTSTAGGAIAITTGPGAISSATLVGISASANVGGNVGVTTGIGAVTGFTDGILASSGAGSVTVTTNGAVTGTTLEGISASSMGNVLVTTNGAVSGGTDGIQALAVGGGTVTVNTTAGGLVTGGAGNGILATSATGAVLITTAAVTGHTNGVNATSTSGPVSVTTNGAVTSTTGQGIVAGGGTTGNVVVATNSTVTGATNGIVASATGAGTVTVNSTVGGLVTGAAEIGIVAGSGTGALSVTTGPVTGGAIGVEAVSAGGAITVTTNGVVTGGAAGGGILAVSLVAGGAGNVLVTANNTVTGGFGIAAEMLGAGNTGNVTVMTVAPVTGTTTTGISTVSVAGINTVTADGTVTGATTGINATSATGAVFVNGTGAVRGTTALGINATSAGGNVTVAQTNTVAGGTTGINAATTGAGTVTVTATNNVAGAAGNGIATSAVDGATQVTVVNAGTTITGAGAGNSAISATSGGAGNINVAVAAGTTVVNTTGRGVSLDTVGAGAGTGAATLGTNGTITGLGSFADPTILVTNNKTAANPVTIANGVLGTITNAAKSATGWAIVATGPGGTAAGGTPTNIQPVIVDNSGQIVGRIQLGGGVDAFNNLATGVWSVSGASNQLGNGSTISNAVGGTIDIGSGPGSATSFTFTNIAGAQTGTDTIANAGLINSTGAVTFTFDPANTIINNSGVFNVGSVAGSATESTAFNTTGGGKQTVNNTGTFNVLALAPQTGTYTGTLSFTGAGGSQFNNTRGLINMQADGNSPKNAVTLNSKLSGTSDLNYTYTWGALATSSYNFSGSTGNTSSQLKVDTFLGAPGSTSDRLVVGGNVTGVTQIQVNNVNPGPGSLNTTGITVVAVQGTGSNNFVVSPTTPNFVNFGPLGAIASGAFVDPLLYVPGGATSANAQPNGNAYKLFSLPGPFLTQLPLAITAAQNIWQQTALGWEDRQDELRSYYDCGMSAGAQAYGGGADLPTRKSPPPPVAAGCSGTPSVWLKAVASGTSFTDQENLGKAFNNPLFNGLGWSNSYKQETFGVVGGVDGGKSQVFSPTDSIVFGVMGGYLDSQVSFNSPNVLSGPATFTGFSFTGGTVGVSADYMNGGFFIDALAKVDLMRLNISGIPGGFLGGGLNNQSVRSDTWGVLDNIGYRFEHGRWFVEPIGTFQYIDAHIGNLALPGAGVNANFGRGEAFDVAGGVRAGGVVMDDRVHYLEAALTAKVWDPVSVNNVVNFTSIPNVPGTAFPLTANFTDPYGEVGLQLDWINRTGVGWSAFAKADAQLNQQFVTVTAKGGITYGF